MMRGRGRVCAYAGLTWVLVVGLAGCAARTPSTGRAGANEPSPEFTDTPMPTVPPATATPAVPAAAASATPLAAAQDGKAGKPAKGKLIGPEVTFFGAARADGTVVPPESVDKQGIPTYRSAAGSGFIIIVEAKPGPSGLDVGRRTFVYVPGDPNLRSDMEIQSNRNLGDGSAEVCDRQRPKIGGVPAIAPVSFAKTQKVSDAINDFACRFETFVESDSSCTMNANGDYSFENKETTTQFCMMVARAYGFPIGDTVLSVRMLDTGGNPGPVRKMRIHHPPEPAKAPAAAKNP